jgi:hypothetical protein
MLAESLKMLLWYFFVIASSRDNVRMKTCDPV